MEVTLGVALKFYTIVGKGLKLKVRKFWQLIPTFVKVTGEKQVRWGGGGGVCVRGFCSFYPNLPPSWIGNVSNQILQCWKAPTSKSIALCLSNFNLPRKRLWCLKKKAQFSRRCFYWKDIDILITRVGKSSRTEIHKSLQNLKEKTNMKIMQTLLLALIRTMCVSSFF